MAVVPALKGTTLAPNRPTRPEAQSNRSSTVVLTYDEVTSLLHGLDFQSSDGLMWCWRSLLWGRINQAGTDFEEWICSVTKAIIFC
jgi:hypothetical protein